MSAENPPVKGKTFVEHVRGQRLEIFIPEGELKAPMSAPSSARVTSFATFKDLVGYARCMQKGNDSDFCYRQGDSGVGAWGDVTAQIRTPMVALPPEAMIRRWGTSRAARGKKVRVWIDGIDHPVICEVRDKGPEGVVDLNPAALDAFGLPIDTELNRSGKWEWV